jgi:hypothetical protein
MEPQGRPILRPVNPPMIVSSSPEKPTSVALLPFVNTTFNRISGMLSRYNIKSVGLPPKKIKINSFSYSCLLGCEPCSVVGLCKRLRRTFLWYEGHNPNLHLNKGPESRIIDLYLAKIHEASLSRSLTAGSWLPPQARYYGNSGESSTNEAPCYYCGVCFKFWQ